MTKLIVAFGNFENAPEMKPSTKDTSGAIAESLKIILNDIPEKHEKKEIHTTRTVVLCTFFGKFDMFIFGNKVPFTRILITE
jgi:hypothetical protein